MVPFSIGARYHILVVEIDMAAVTGDELPEQLTRPARLVGAARDSHPPAPPFRFVPDFGHRAQQAARGARRIRARVRRRRVCKGCAATAPKLGTKSEYSC